jgi:CNT family concentrative nucleoside transporter
LGIKIAGMIVATLLCIIALIGLINGLLGWWGR